MSGHPFRPARPLRMGMASLALAGIALAASAHLASARTGIIVAVMVMVLVAFAVILGLVHHVLTAGSPRPTDAAWLARVCGAAAFDLILAGAGLGTVLLGQSDGWGEAAITALVMAPVMFLIVIVYLGVGVDQDLPGPVISVLAWRAGETAALVAVGLAAPLVIGLPAEASAEVGPAALAVLALLAAVFTRC